MKYTYLKGLRTLVPENYHDANPFYRAEIPGDFDLACYGFNMAMLSNYAQLNARAEARFDEECVRLSRPALDKPPGSCEV